jgi:hypothetical protein
MIKIQGIGCPFNIEHSSCSTMKPKLFSWSNEQQEIQVYIDGAILQGLKTPRHEHKYAWICESRFIGSAKDIRQQLLLNKEQILTKYKYLFTCDKELCSLDERIKWIYAGSNLPWCFGRNSNYFIPEKTKLVSMICSPKDYSEGHRYRLKVAKELQPYVDLYGGAHGSARPGEGTGAHRDKSDAIDPYMFSIVLENDSYPSYFTEKITDCFARGTVPIYHGDPEICNYFDCSGIIPYSDGIVNKLNKNVYDSMKNGIENNMKLISEMPIAEDYFVKEFILK